MLLGQLGPGDGAGRRQGLRAASSPNAIVCDMGGTSFDVSLIRDGYIKFTRETWLGGDVHRPHDGPLVGRREEHRRRRRQHRLDRLRRPAARRPATAPGADPGPGVLRARRRASRRSPTRPSSSATSTRTTSSAAGSSSTAERRARGRPRRIAEPLGLGVEQAAYAILAVANEHMVAAIRDITINEGLDPRDSVIVAGGGAGGHRRSRGSPRSSAAPRSSCRARRARCRPAAASSRTSSPSSASAGARDTNRFDFGAVNAGLARARRAHRRVLRPAAGRPPRPAAQGVLRRGALPVPGVGARGAAARRALRGRRRRRDDGRGLPHACTSASSPSNEPGQHVECVYWKGRGTARLPKPGLRRSRAERRGREARTGTGAAWLRAGRRASTRPSTSARRSRRASGLPGPGDRRGADDHDRRPAGLVADRAAESGDYLLERSDAVTVAPRTTFDPMLLAVLANRLDAHRAAR